MEFNVNKSGELIDHLLSGKTVEEQVKILKNCLDHAVDHPWVDRELKDSILSNIAKEYEVSYVDADDEDDETDADERDYEPETDGNPNSPLYDPTVSDNK